MLVRPKCYHLKNNPPHSPSPPTSSTPTPSRRTLVAAARAGEGAGWQSVAVRHPKLGHQLKAAGRLGQGEEALGTVSLHQEAQAEA